MDNQEREPKNADEAIFNVYRCMVRIEAVLLGVPDTADKGLVGQVIDNKNDLDCTRKKLGKLDVRVWVLIALLTGSGILGGTAIAQLLAA